jgi:hypothetical protein
MTIVITLQIQEKLINLVIIDNTINDDMGG